MSPIERYASDFGGFSEVVVSEGPGRWLHIAGQVGLGDDGAVVAGGIAAETARTFDHIERILGRVGADLSHLVSISVYLTDLSEYGEFARVRQERLGAHLPASAAVEVGGLLLEARVEIDAVGFVPR